MNLSSPTWACHLTHADAHQNDLAYIYNTGFGSFARRRTAYSPSMRLTHVLVGTILVSRKPATSNS
jgi:hypothetical protein